ncbi:ergothioneine biosynthesis glutamate--cysteine ligase EgtA [Sphaerimonospora cavernae]|uniref:Glutamate--cysteine ligase EgtA n=1 Tax=Sphaerimonospora cavernae TaxID=1740611 RepID=A0ABV6UCG9_9ACTN
MLLDDISRRRAVTEQEAEARLADICFKTGTPRRIGIEVEWLVHDLLEPRDPVAPARLTRALAAVGGLPLRSALTIEPGGQLELSSRPAVSLTACASETAADLELVRTRLACFGLGLAGYGLDPWHPPRRILDHPRYVAMERYFDRTGPDGRVMMSATASVQICLDAGQDGAGPFGIERRWRLAHLLGPVLVAAFANSPLRQGRPTGWKSTRQGVWASLDQVRGLAPGPGPSAREAWTTHALDTPVLCVRTPEGPWETPAGLTLRDWIRGGGPRPVTVEDIDYHLTTLFPPVRPRGHLELRMIDAQPGPDGWVVPMAVTAALFDDLEAAEFAHRVADRLADQVDPGPRNLLWREAACRGLEHPGLHTAAVDCFAAARRALPRLGASADVLAAVADFTDRYVTRGRCPADDLLDRISRKESQT